MERWSENVLLIGGEGTLLSAMQKSVHVDLGKRAYGVEIGAGILIPELEKLKLSGENDSGVRCSLNEVALVTDTSVAELSWYQQARELLRAQASAVMERSEF